MKNFIRILVIAFILVPFATKIVSSAEDKLTLTQEQKNFAEEVSSNVGILKAEWANTYVLDVIYEKHWHGVVTPTSAKTKATLLATQGYILINQSICVKILDYKLRELGYKCVGDQSES